MASIHEYLEKMCSEQLGNLLRADVSGQLDLPTDTVLLICEILQKRDPVKPDVREAFQRFVKHYIPDEEETSECNI